MTARSEKTVGQRFIVYRNALGINRNVAYAARHGITESAIRKFLGDWGAKTTARLPRTWRMRIARDGGNLEYVEQGKGRPLLPGSRNREQLRLQLASRDQALLVEEHIALLEKHDRSLEYLRALGVLGREGEISEEQAEKLRGQPETIKLLKRMIENPVPQEYLAMIEAIAERGRKDGQKLPARRSRK